MHRRLSQSAVRDSVGISTYSFLLRHWRERLVVPHAYSLLAYLYCPAVVEVEKAPIPRHHFARRGKSRPSIRWIYLGCKSFRDLDNNYLLGSGEKFKITDSEGRYSDLSGAISGQLIADSNNGKAVDVATGLPFLAKLIAPADYEVITPVTTMVSALMLTGRSQAAAEDVVKRLGFSLSLDSYDPFSHDGADATSYKEFAVKFANVLMASDGDLSVEDSSDLSETMTAVADVLQDSVSKGQLLDLSSPTVLAKLLPSVSATVLSSVVTANEPTGYAEVLDKQLLLLADNGWNPEISKRRRFSIYCHQDWSKL